MGRAVVSIESDDSGRRHVVLHQLQQVGVGRGHGAPADLERVGAGSDELDARRRGRLLSLEEPQVLEAHLNNTTMSELHKLYKTTKSNQFHLPTGSLT